MSELTSDSGILIKRVVRLLRREAPSLWGSSDHSNAHQLRLPLNAKINHSTIGAPIKAIKDVGDLALVGGAVRDVARRGLKAFSSDLDFVLYNGNLPAFYKLVERLGGRRNRFGGYRLHSCGRYFDIWALEDTWARTAGIRTVNELTDIIYCTFFDWDAIIYDVTGGRLIAKSDYFKALSRGVMELNLPENPNPSGSLVRALRRGKLWQVAFGPKLSAFSLRHLNSENWSKLVSIDKQAFNFSVLDKIDVNDLRKALENYRHDGSTEPFGSSLVQPELPYI